MNCSITNCEKAEKVRGYCKHHYRKKYLLKIHPLYIIWQGIVQRCENKNCKAYDYYGGRGIIVCKLWRENYKEFENYMGDRPSLKHTVDRINTNGNYEPGNVRWASKQEQQRNRKLRKTNTTSIHGVVYNEKFKRYRTRISYNSKTIYGGSFKTLEEAKECRIKLEKMYPAK